MPKTDAPEHHLKSLAGPAQRYLKFNLLSTIMGGLCILAQAWLTALIISGVIIDHLSLDDVWPLIITLFGVFILRFIASAAAGYYAGKASIAVKTALRETLYNRIVQSGSLSVIRRGSGALVTTLTDGVEAVGKYYQEYLPAMSAMRVIPLVIVAVVFTQDLLSGFILLVTAPLIPVFMILIGKGAEKLNNKQWQKLARMGNHFMDAVQGLQTLKTYNAAKRESIAIAETSEQYRRDTMAVLRLAFLSSVTLEFFATVSIALVAVLTGFRLLWGEIDFFNGFFVLLLAPEFYLPLRRMGAARHTKMESVGAMNDIALILDAPVLQTQQKSPDDIPDLSAVALDFKNICYSYEANIPALKYVTASIPAGAKVAIIGESGAGKSTLLSLMLRRIDPTEGSLSINGIPLSDIEPRIWRSHIGWIPQNPTIFYGSVIENIRMGNHAATDDDVISLCKTLGIHDFITALPEGYNTFVGENGYGLSGGQNQRIAIARAFIRNAPLLLMDEPTASLDRKTEATLQQAMDVLAKGKTVITIAHRLRTIQNADVILYMKGGEIVDRGSHTDLIARNQNYAALIAREIADDEKRSAA